MKLNSKRYKTVGSLIKALQKYPANAKISVRHLDYLPNGLFARSPVTIAEDTISGNGYSFTGDGHGSTFYGTLNIEIKGFKPVKSLQDRIIS